MNPERIEKLREDFMSSARDEPVKTVIDYRVKYSELRSKLKSVFLKYYHTPSDFVRVEEVAGDIEKILK